PPPGQQPGGPAHRPEEKPGKTAAADGSKPKLTKTLRGPWNTEMDEIHTMLERGETPEAAESKVRQLRDQYGVPPDHIVPMIEASKADGVFQRDPNRATCTAYYKAVENLDGALQRLYRRISPDYKPARPIPNGFGARAAAVPEMQPKSIITGRG